MHRDYVIVKIYIDYHDYGLSNNAQGEISSCSLCSV